METTKENYPQKNPSRKIVFGVIVILAGLLLLMMNLGSLPYHLGHIIFSWQMLLIAIGIISLSRREGLVPGVILIMIGGFFILPRVFYFSFNMVHLFWPALLIAIGVLIILRRFPRSEWHRKGIESHHVEGFIFEDNIFSGSKQRITSQAFKGGRINCVFGGSEIDLSSAALSPGTNELDINVVFGGVTLIVPADWKVILKNSSVLGGFSDKRAVIKDPPDPSTILVIKASAVFGGGELKSY
jgi:predicted membrane protein